MPPLLLVKPCDPEHSFLYMKLKLPVTATDPKDGYGEHMPKGNPSLPDEQLLGIHDWIARGAHRNEPDTVTGNTCQVEDMGMPDLGTPPDLSATPPDLATPADLANPDALPKG